MIQRVNQETLLCMTMPLTKVTEEKSKIINPLLLSTYLTHGYALRSKVKKKKSILIYNKNCKCKLEQCKTARESEAESMFWKIVNCRVSEF